MNTIEELCKKWLGNEVRVWKFI